MQVCKRAAELRLQAPPSDVVEETLLAPRMFRGGAHPRLTQLLRLLQAPPVHVPALVSHRELGGFPMDASEKDDEIGLIVVEKSVISGGQWIQSYEELIDPSPLTGLVAPLQVQYPHVAISHILLMPTKENDRRVIGSRVTGNHAGTSSSWGCGLRSEWSDLQPLVHSCIILPGVTEVIRSIGNTPWFGLRLTLR